MKKKVGLLVFLMICILMPVSAEAFEGNWFVECESMLKNLGTALEMYASDNFGDYPVQLKNLTPDYINTIPRCPVSQLEYGYKMNQNPDLYTAWCRGWSHRDAIKDGAGGIRNSNGELNPVITTTEGFTTSHEPVPTAEEDRIAKHAIQKIAHQKYFKICGPFIMGILFVVAVAVISAFAFQKRQDESSN